MIFVTWLVSTAGATEVTCDMQTVPSGALEACRCIFEFEEAEWIRSSLLVPGPVNPVGTCFEYTRVVNSIDASQRLFALNHLNPVANHFACYAAPNTKLTFEYTTKQVLYTSGYWPLVTTQLTTMAKDDCGLGNGIANRLEQWYQEASGTWLIENDSGDPFVRVSANGDGKILRVWAFDEDGDGLEDLLIWWDKAIAWVAHGPFDLAEPVPPPDL